MSRQIELALISLMPSYVKDIPPLLVELASSLLAQSRNQASTLKAEEEIARLYACANIACERLKIQLDLPPIEPRPPVPPRIYKRLYSHLDNILPSTTSGARRSSGRVRTKVSKFGAEESTANSSSQPLLSSATSSKDQSLNQFRKNPTPVGKKAAGVTNDESERTGLPPWVAPVIRFFSVETGSKKLAPTMLAGTESILFPGGQKMEDEWANGQTTEVLAAVLYHVTIRFQAVTSGVLVDSDGCAPIRKEILGILGKARKEVVFVGAEDAGAWDGWATVKVKDFDAVVETAREKGWLDSDWYRGIDDVVRNIGDGDVNMDDGDEGALEGSGRRADTMFQDRYDFLSESRRADYKTWKETQLARIDKLLMEQGAMEIDAQ
ncbi:Origin recognition subunit 6 [Cordyceps militaris]|uniref:Origin recognition subunit 6 n=1 Tax=Cordyceps militaris TaxID=73501 RepID=A0A2H4S5Q6_CORMI|nr:Origin recognition subunit 6 [Cordyceps militaris]